jgi:N-acetylglutamate synthase-like GNAT family acetyltransferase
MIPCGPGYLLASKGEPEAVGRVRGKLLTYKDVTTARRRGFNMVDWQILDLTPDNIADYGVCGYKDVKKHRELRRKIDWFKEYYPKGLRIKIIHSKEGGYQGMLEYIPGKYAHRPVDAEGYMFIHCVFVGFKKEFKGKGYASSLINECIKEAKNTKMYGVAVVTRKGSFMVRRDIFIKNGFITVDKADPDFELLVLKFNHEAENPKFKNMSKHLEAYEKGLFILRSFQCPYTEKNVNAILKSAKDKFALKANLIDLKDSDAVQNSPCPFGSFCIIYNGEIISHHPISNARFENIMKKVL